MSAVSSIPASYFADAAFNAKAVMREYMREITASKDEYAVYVYHDLDDVSAPLLCFFQIIRWERDDFDLILDRAFLGDQDATGLITAYTRAAIVSTARADAAKQREQSRTENRIAAMEAV